jgi:hypothetical protein
MSARPAQAAAQSDPARNFQFRRWLPDGATGQETGQLRTWHAADVTPPMSRARRIAEARWAKIVRPEFKP